MPTKFLIGSHKKVLKGGFNFSYDGIPDREKGWLVEWFLMAQGPRKDMLRQIG